MNAAPMWLAVPSARHGRAHAQYYALLATATPRPHLRRAPVANGNCAQLLDGPWAGASRRL